MNRAAAQRHSPLSPVLGGGRGPVWLSVDSRIQVRHARPADADALALLFVASARQQSEFAPHGWAPPSIAETAARYRDVLGVLGSRHVVLLVEFAGDVLGSIELSIGAPSEAQRLAGLRRTATIHMALLPLHRLAGVGRLLTDAAERWARQQRADALLLEVHGGDATARVFYRTCGWEDHGTLMVKRLASV